MGVLVGRQGVVLGTFHAEQAAGADETRKCQHRNQKGEPVPEPEVVAIPGFRAEPVVKTDAGMGPGEHDHDRQVPALGRPGGPQDEGIVVIDAEKAVRPARAHDMPDQEEGQGEAEGELHYAARADAPGLDLQELADAEDQMGREGKEQDGGSDRTAGDRLARVLHHVHRLDRHEAERVVQQVGQHEGEQDQAGYGSQPRGGENLRQAGIAAGDAERARDRALLYLWRHRLHAVLLLAPGAHRVGARRTVPMSHRRWRDGIMRARRGQAGRRNPERRVPAGVRASGRHSPAPARAQRSGLRSALWCLRSCWPIQAWRRG